MLTVASWQRCLPSHKWEINASSFTAVSHFGVANFSKNMWGQREERLQSQKPWGGTLSLGADANLPSFYSWFQSAVRDKVIKPGIKLARDTVDVNKKRSVYKRCCDMQLLHHKFHPFSPPSAAMCPGCCSLSKEKYNFSVHQLIQTLNKRVACPIVIVAQSHFKCFPHPSSAGFPSVSHDRPPLSRWEWTLRIWAGSPEFSTVFLAWCRPKWRSPQSLIVVWLIWLQRSFKKWIKKPQKAYYAKLLTVTPDALYIF